MSNFIDLYRVLFSFPKPLVAAINGHAVAGGCMLANACDHRVMASGRAKISLNEVTFGATLPAGSAEMLAYWVGSRHAEALALSGRMVDASEVAYVAVFLCSNQAGAMTGELLIPNGGALKAVFY